MSQNGNVAIVAFAIAGWMFVHNGGSTAPPLVASTAEPTPVAHFDYGDGVGSAPDRTTPIIDSVEAVGAVGASAFDDDTSQAGKVIDGTELKQPSPPPAVPPVLAPPVAAQNPLSQPAPPPSPPSAFADPPQQAAAVAASDWVNNVFPIRCNGHYGCAVSVTPDTLVSVHHVATHAAAQIALSSGTVAANVSHPPGADDGYHDTAVVKVPNGQFPTLQTRSPVYYEPVTVYGLTTKTKQRGYISGIATVSLLPENGGIKSGDSGGAVVADDGCLVGLISGFENNGKLGFPDNPHVVLITRIDYLLPYIPKNNTKPTNAVKPAAEFPVEGQLPQPVGSVFPTQPSAFDPPVNTNQPAVVPQQASGASCNTSYTVGRKRGVFFSRWR